MLGWPLRALKKYRFAVSAAIRSLAILQVQDSAIASIRITKRWNGRCIICVLKKSDWCAKCIYRVWRNWKPICLIRRGRIWIPTRPPAGRITRRNIGTGRDSGDGVMDALTLQQKIYSGYAKAAQRLGLETQVFRPTQADDPFTHPVLTLKACFNASRTTGAAPRLGQSTWQGRFDGRQTQAGDYLWREEGGIWFIAALALHADIA